MAFKFFEKKKEKLETEKAENRLPFDQREKVYPLCLFFTIVNRNQSAYYTKAYADAGASLSMVFYSHSQPPEEIASVLGPDNLKKEIIFTVTRSEYVEKLKHIAEERFKISSAAKGIAFVCPIDSVSGISVYKFLSDQNKEIRENEQNAK